MYSDDGNAIIHKMVEHIIEQELQVDTTVVLLLNVLGRVDAYAECLDTAVRDCIFNAIEHRLDNNVTYDRSLFYTPDYYIEKWINEVELGDYA
jgi:hypothetical protein